MRVTVTPSNHPEWGFTLSDASHLNRMVRHGVAWILAKDDGLEGWYESADTRVDSMPDLPGVDGQFWPEQVLLTARTLAIRGYVFAVDGRASSVSVALARDRIAALVGEPLTVTVEDPSGVREVTGYVSGRTAPNRMTELGFPFSIVVTCPDPLKYGGHVNTVAGDGVVVLENAGTGPVAFTVSTDQRITQLQVEFQGRKVSWWGDSLGLVLDLADGRPLSGDGVETGQLLSADEIRVPVGRHEVSVLADAPVMVSLRPGWR